MAKKEMSKFEKRRKGVETIFDIMFLIMLIVTIEDLVFGEYTGVELIFRIQLLVLLFACTIDLVDENKQVIAQNSTFINQNDNIATKEISPKMSQEGALYFDTQYLTNTKTFDETVITRAKYLKLGVLASASVNDGRLTGDNEDYYIELR